MMHYETKHLEISYITFTKFHQLSMKWISIDVSSYMSIRTSVKNESRVRDILLSLLSHVENWTIFTRAEYILRACQSVAEHLK